MLYSFLLLTNKIIGIYCGYMSKQKVLIYDIENTPTVVTTWGLWDRNFRRMVYNVCILEMAR